MKRDFRKWRRDAGSTSEMVAFNFLGSETTGSSGNGKEDRIWPSGMISRDSDNLRFMDLITGHFGRLKTKNKSQMQNITIMIVLKIHEIRHTQEKSCQLDPDDILRFGRISGFDWN